MLIYIPTRSRPNTQRAYDQMERAGFEPMLVIDDDQKALYKGKRFITTPAGGGIAGARQRALSHAGKRKHVVFDDDTTIASVDMEGEKCAINNDPSPARVRKEIARADKLLDTHAHGGIHTRHFVNHAKKPVIFNRGYPRQIMFFNPALMPVIPKYVGRTAEDVIFFLKCLDQGLDYFLLTSCCMIEKKSAELRTHFNQEMKNEDMVELVGRRYAEFVKPTRDGRITIGYARVLKAAKARIARGEEDIL